MLITAGIFAVSCGLSNASSSPRTSVSVSPGVSLSKKTPIVVTAAEYSGNILKMETTLQTNGYRVVSAATSIDLYPNIDVLLEVLQSSTVYVLYYEYVYSFISKDMRITLKITDQKTGIIVLSAESKCHDCDIFKTLATELNKYFR
jgi:hypothetical protein